MKKISFLTYATMGFLCVNIASAQCLGTRGNTLSLTLAGGEEFFASKRHIENSGLTLGALDYNFNCMWGVEALYAGFTTHFKPERENEESDRGNLVLFDVVFRPINHNGWEPYITAGVGITNLESNRHADANNEGNINAGIGLSYFIHPVIAFRAEARDIYTIFGGKNDVVLDAGITAYFDLC